MAQAHCQLPHLASLKSIDTLPQALMSDESKLPVEVRDVFVVPDYVSFLGPCMDVKFGRYSKCAWIQLKSKFQAVQPCADFPLGVKTTYRASRSG